MAAVLREKGFEVTEATDLDYARLNDAVRAFGERLRSGRGVGLVYYAGHGVEIDGVNYLIPVNNAEIKDELDVQNRAVSVNTVLARLEASGASLTLLILDACRENPFPGSTRTLKRGLKRVDNPQGTLIAFATDPGAVASDNPGGRNGLYTQHLVEAIRTPGLKVEDVFKRVRQTVG